MLSWLFFFLNNVVYVIIMIFIYSEKLLDLFLLIVFNCVIYDIFLNNMWFFKCMCLCVNILSVFNFW